MPKCEHYACRCARARELAAMYDNTGRVRYLREAIEVHEQRVECREVAFGGFRVVTDPAERSWRIERP